VRQYQFDEAANNLKEEAVILGGIPGAANHNGGRLAFGPDGYLYITTGDAQQEELAQDTRSLAGKILRVAGAGEIPPDNPFGNAVYSVGHRNVQGIAWDSRGRLWASEHGPSGAASGCDEINLIEKGKNYGWPRARCEQSGEGLAAPVLQSGRRETWAPSGIAIVDDWLLVAGLRGEAVYGAKMETDKLTAWSKRLTGYGRVRTVKARADGLGVWVLTSNRDGRGEAARGDDKLVLVPRAKWEL
jgi:glucose/arabinose dehydrogenase